MHTVTIHRLAGLCALVLSGVCVTGAALAQEAEGGAAPPEEASPAAPPEQQATATPTVDDHLQALGALDATARINAVRALGRERDPRVVAALTRVLRGDPSAEVRGWAVRSLDEIGTPEARAAIAATARSDSDERVRALAAHIVPEAAPPPAPPVPMYGSQAVTGDPYYEARRPARRQVDAARRFRLAGWLTFGISYGINLTILGPVFLLVGDEGMGWPLFLPIIGPVIAAGYSFDSGWEEDIIAAAMDILWTCIQTTGLALAIVGHVRRRRERRENRERSASRVQVSVVPSGTGLLVGGIF